MEPSINLDDDKKLDVLKFLITENNKELVYWRDRNWNTLKLTVGSYIAMSGVSYFKEGAYSLVLLVIGIAVLSTIYLKKNFNRYQEKRDMGTRLEAEQKLFVMGGVKLLGLGGGNFFVVRSGKVLVIYIA